MSKGTCDHLKKSRQAYMLVMLMNISAIALAILLKGVTPVWIGKYLTILAGVLIVPFSLYLTKYVTIMPYKTCNALQQLLENHSDLHDKVKVDLLLVPIKRTYHLLGAACYGDEVHIYTKDRRVTKLEVERMYQKRAVSVNCFIYNDHQLFVKVIKDKKNYNEDNLGVLLSKSL